MNELDSVLAAVDTARDEIVELLQDLVRLIAHLGTPGAVYLSCNHVIPHMLEPRW
jgi:hypothetical protein